MYPLELSSVKSSLANIKLFEHYNKTNLNKLYKTNLLKTVSWNEYDNEKNQLQLYEQQSTINEYNNNTLDYGFLPVTYKRAKGYSFGRVYPIKSLSLCSIRKEIRHTIANDIYVDIDIENAHPNFIYQTMKYHNKECKILEDYIVNRSKHLQDVMNQYKVQRDQAKTLFIILCYFGSFKTWLKECKIDINTKPTKFIEQFINERNVWGKEIEDHNENILLEVQANKTKKNIFYFNESASVVSIWCQEIENRILETVYKYCKKNKFIVDSVCVLCFDGIMIEKKYFKESLITNLHELIKKEFGYNLKFISKPLDKGYNNQISKITLQNDSAIDTNDSDSEEENTQSENENSDDDFIIEQPQQNNSLEDIKKSDKEFFKKLKFMSHADMAETFYNINKYKYIYSPISKWWQYNEYYILQNTGQDLPSGMKKHITKCLVEYLMPIRNRMKPNSPSYTEDCKNINKLIKDVSNANFLFGISQFLQDYYCSNDIDKKIDSNPNLIAFSDKVFDKSILNIRDIKPDDYISKTVGYKYTTSNKEIRKYILDVIKSIFENNEMEEYFIRIKSLSLFGNISESCFIQVGLGGNGKGLLATLEKTALGDYTMTTENTFITSVFKQGQANSTLASTKGIRNLVISEPNDSDEHQRDANLNSPFLKLITGNDDITTRQLYRDNITFKPQFTPFIQANNLPNLKRIDNGIMRRIKIINYPFMFVDNPSEIWHRKKNYELKTLFEKTEYASEYLLILLDYIKNNINTNVIIPDSVTNETNKYFDDNNPVKNFIDNFITKKEGNRIKSSEVKDHFDSNFSEQKLTASQFIKAMKMNGYDTIIHYGIRKFVDIDICIPETEEQENIEIDM